MLKNSDYLIDFYSMSISQDFDLKTEGFYFGFWSQNIFGVCFVIQNLRQSVQGVLQFPSTLFGTLYFLMKNQ